MPSVLSPQQPMPTQTNFVMTLTIGLMAMVFWVDLYIPLGVAGGVPYVAVILLTLWLPNSSFTWVLAILCSVLTLLGFWWSPPGGELWKVVFNRSLALFAIWATTLLSLVHKKHLAQFHAEGLAFRTMMDLMPCMVFARNQQGHIISANQASKRFFGRNENELNAQRAYGVYPTIAQEIDARERESEMMQSGSWQGPQVETFVNDQGEHHVFLTSKFPFLWPDTGEPVIGTIAVDEAQRREELAKLRLTERVIDSSSDHISIVGKDYRYQRVNPAHERAHGVAHQDIVGMHIQELVGSDVFQEIVKPEFDQCLKGQDIHYENWFLFDQQGRRYMAVSYTPLKDDKGNIDGVVVISRDRTEDQLSDGGVAYQASLLSAVVDASSDAIFVKDLNGKYLRINQAGAQMMSLSPNQVLGNNDLELFGKEMGQTLMRADREVVRREESIMVEERLILGGEVRVFSTMKAPLRNARGNMSGVIGVARDITQRKDAQDALLQSEYRYRSLIETAGSVIIGLDCNGHITEWNREAESLYGQTREEILGQNYLSLFLNEKEREAVEADIKKVLAGTPTRDFENPIQAAGGQERVLMWNVDRLLDSTQTPVGLIAIGRDMTERKDAEVALQEAERFARSTMDALSTNICVLDSHGTILRVNNSWRTFAEANLMNPECVGEGQNYLNVCDQASGDFAEEAPMMAAAIRQIISGDRTECSFEYPCHSPTKDRWFLANVRRFPGAGPERIVVAHEDITKLKQSERLLMMERVVLETIATGQPLQVILDTLTQQIEQSWPGMMCSILLLDESGTRLFPASAPSLPREYINAISGLQIGPSVGSCGTAANTGKRVIAENIAQDPLWEDYRELARTYGFQACWSILIMGKEDRVLGTFAMYYVEPRTPTEEEITAITTVAHLASIGIERRQTEALLAESEQRFDLAIWGSNDGLWDWPNIQKDGEWWSPRFYELLGYESHEFEASFSQFQKLLHPDDVQPVMEAVQAHMEHDVPFDVEYRLKTKCGESRWFHARGKKVLDEKGQPLRMAGSIQDIQDRRQGEIALQESEQRLAMALEATSSGTWDWNVETGEVLFGDQWLSALGYTREQVAPHVQSWESLVHPNDMPAVQEALQRHFAGETPYYECINRLRNADGEWRWNLDRGRVVEWTADGKPLRMVGTDTDISARIHAEQALKDSEARLQAILDNSPGLIFLKDLDGRYLHVNRRFKEMFDITKEDIIGKTDDEVFAVEQALQFKSHDRQVVASRQLLEFEEVAAYADGPHTSIVHKFPLFNEKNEMFAVGGITTDITARKFFENALSESEKKFRVIFEQVAVGVAQIVSRSGEFVQVNQRYCEIVGYSQEEMLSRTLQDITHPDDLRVDLDNMTRLLNGQIDMFSMEKRYFRKGGTIVWVNLTVSPMWQPGEEPSYHIAVVEDITERKRLEVENREYNEALEGEVEKRAQRIQELEQRRMQVEKLAALAQVAAGVAHEINNPLASIGQSLEVLKRAIPATHPRYKYIGKIQDSVDRMAHIVRKMYQLYRSDTASQEPVSIHEILRRTIEIMKDFAKSKGVSLVENVPEDLPWAKVSRNSVTQVLCNIIQNALDVSQRNGIVEIGLEEKADTVVVWVMDHGPGIFDDVAPHIFDPFFTTKDGSSLEGGMGLGLAVSHRLIESCGGSIDFSTELGQGTIFRVTIPIESNF